MSYGVRVLRHTSGFLTVIHPAMNDRGRPPGVSNGLWARRCLDLTIAKHPEWQGFESADLLSDTLPSRRFRDAWRLVVGQVTEDLAACRAIRLAEVRRDRDARMPQFDAEWLKATGQGDAARAAAVEARRQALRDVPQVAAPALAACTTPAKIAAFTPAWPELP